jgi:hypothetical protein
MSSSFKATLAMMLVGASLTSARCAGQTNPQIPGAGVSVKARNNLYSLEQYCPAKGIHDQACLANALAAIGSAPATLTVAEQISISSTVVIPPNLHLQIGPGSGFDIRGSAYLQISGPLDAPLSQIFYGTRNVYFYGGVASLAVLPQWFGALGNGKATGYTATAGDSAVIIPGSREPFLVGDSAILVGAGPGGSDLAVKVTAVRDKGITVTPAPSTSVSTIATIYNVDDSAALLAWSNSVRAGTTTAAGVSELKGGYEPNTQSGISRLYLPKGIYNVCSSPIIIYSGVLLESEPSQISMGGQLQRCNPNIPVIKLSPNNYDPAGRMTNDGNGNSIFENVAIRDAWLLGHPAPGVLSVPEIMTLPAANFQGDTRFRHSIFETISGDAFRIGFVTNIVGKASPGTTVTLADGSPLYNGQKIIIVGAGPGGTNLTTTIQSGLPSTPMATPLGTPYTITVSSDHPIATPVTNAAVYPYRDEYGMNFERGEIDVAEDRAFSIVGNAAGKIAIDNWEFFDVDGGCLYDSSLSSFGIQVTGSTQFYGCGTSQLASDPQRSAAIYWVDGSGSRTSDFELIDPLLQRDILSSGAILGGNIHVSGMNNVLLDDIKCYDCESQDLAKFLYEQDSNNVTVSNSYVTHSSVQTNWQNQGTSEISFNLAKGNQPKTHVANDTFLNSSKIQMNQIVASGFLLNQPPLSIVGTQYDEDSYKSLLSDNMVAYNLGEAHGPLLMSGAGKPSGTCRNGSLYTQTTYTDADAVIYVCLEGAWKAVLK